MGERYYDPKAGRFISPDPIGLPVCVHLYSYAGGDPINYFDPDGRFFSPVYEPIKPALLKVGTVISDIYHSSRFQGGIQAFGGLAEAGFGAGMTLSTGGVAAPLGWGVMAHGLDHFFTGMSTVITGRSRDSLTSHLLQKTGMPKDYADLADSALSMGGAMKGAAVMRARSSFSVINSVNHEIRLSRGAENVNSAIALRTKLSGLQKAQGSAARIRNLPDSRIRYYSLEIPVVYHCFCK